ncbi:MAG: ABC transporter ATP-binding protein [candidate division WOR-3 bacterium]|nr:ABC transporter ATP-binding protein [candidate division WOR-3 bacterium]
MIVIEAFNVKKTYPSKPPVAALKGCFLEISEGESIALLGPNGAGKTTFLRILTGILLPDEGAITVCGKTSAKSPSEVSRFLRFLPEAPFLLRNNSLWENALFWFSYWDEILPKNNLTEIFERFGLNDRAGEPLSRYSRGMLQKAALSFMLATQAPIIVLDEPTLGLDVITVKEVSDMIKELKKKNKTIIIASHDMPFVEDIADRVALINNGEILELTGISDFKEKYGNPRYLLIYRLGGILRTETFYNHEECNIKLKSIIANDAEIIEFRRECDSLEHILRQLLIKKSEV